MKHYERQERAKGKFVTANPEVASAKLTVRVTPSLRSQVEAIAGNHVAEWLRAAILEKLDREIQS